MARRFWPKVNKNGPIPEHRPDLGPCWIWTSALSSQGYGVLTVNYKQVRATRFAFALLAEPIPDHLHADHLCRVPACVKVIADEDGPAHLEPVTPRENYLRGTSPFADNARKTHCLRGHPFDATNTRILVGGRRGCRTCMRAEKRERRRRQRLESGYGDAQRARR